MFLDPFFQLGPEMADQPLDRPCRRIAQRAEAAKFDMLFLADGQSTKPNDHPAIVVRLEPYTLLSALAACTPFPTALQIPA